MKSTSAGNFQRKEKLAGCTKFLLWKSVLWASQPSWHSDPNKKKKSPHNIIIIIIIIIIVTTACRKSWLDHDTSRAAKDLAPQVRRESSTSCKKTAALSSATDELPCFVQTSGTKRKQQLNSFISMDKHGLIKMADCKDSVNTLNIPGLLIRTASTGGTVYCMRRLVGKLRLASNCQPHYIAELIAETPSMVCNLACKRSSPDSWSSTGRISNWRGHHFWGFFNHFWLRC